MARTSRASRSSGLVFSFLSALSRSVWARSRVGSGLLAPLTDTSTSNRVAQACLALFEVSLELVSMRQTCRARVLLAAPQTPQYLVPTIGPSSGTAESGESASPP